MNSPISTDTQNTSQIGTKRILVVEDDPLMGLLLQDMLELFGYDVAPIPTLVEDALDLIRCEPFDAAVLDINLRGWNTYEIADKLKAMNKPFLFASAYPQNTLPQAYQNCKLLQKPYDINELKVELASLFEN
jgi:DNA-binding response OmpR family regulator